MSKIQLVEELSPQQEAEFPKFRDRWIKIGECTEPIDKQEAYEAVMDCYDLAQESLTRPDFVIFVKSPFQLFYTKPLWNRIVDVFLEIKNEDFLYFDDYTGLEEHDSSLWFTLKFDAEDEWQEIKNGWRVTAIADVFDAIIDATRHKVPDIDFRGDERAYRRAFAYAQQMLMKWLPNNLDTLIEEAQRESGSEIYGQNETWLCFYDYMEWAGSKGLEGTHGLQRMAKAAGWWIPYDSIAVVADRPKELLLDNEGRLHSYFSHAIQFRDGWKYYASHGTEIPYWYIEHPEWITVEKIDKEENAEFRRIMLEIYGLDNYLKEGKAELVDRDPDPQIGTLWVKHQDDDEDIFMLEMRNSTQEQDGSYKTYVIRVPPNMTTARQANAWSYQCEPDEYNPVFQS